MRCPDCRREIEHPGAGTQFCPRCGARLHPSPAGEPPEDLEPSAGVLAAAWKLLLPMGIVVLAGAMAHGLLSKSGALGELDREASELEATLRGLQRAVKEEGKALEDLKDRLAESKRQVGQEEGDLAALLESDPRLSGDPARAIEEVRRQVETIEAGKADGEKRRKPPPPAPETSRSVPAPIPAPEPEQEPEVAGRRLDACRESVVTVLSSSRQLATGLIIGEGGPTRYVVTVSAAAPHGSDVACLFRAGDRGAEGRFVAAGATVVYRSDRLRLALLACASKETPLARPFALQGRAPAVAKGDRAFAVGTQVIGSAAFSDNVLEGSVSALDRSVDGNRFFGTTIPAGEGSLGAPVVNASGDLVGLLWRAEEGLEKASLVLPREELRPLVERMEREIARRTDPLSDAPKPLEIGAGTQLGPDGNLPYRRADSIDLPRPVEEKLEAFPGPGDLLVVWDAIPKRLSAHKRGRGEPIWSKKFTGNYSLTLACQPWGPQALLSGGLMSQETVEVDLKAGKATVLPPISSIAGAPNFSLMGRPPWASFPLGSFRVFALDRGLAIADLTSAKGFALPLDIILMARNEDLYTFSTLSGNLGWFTRSEFLPVLARIATAIDNLQKAQNAKLTPNEWQEVTTKLRAQIDAYVGELKKGLKVFEVGAIERDPTRPRSSFSHVPGTYLHIIGRTVWQIGPRSVVQVGRLERIRHSASDEDWFRSYLWDEAQPCAMASPDGRYAVTATHLFDLKEMRPLVELPFPTGPAWFSSSGSTVFAFDARNRRIVSLAVEDLLASCRGPYGEPRAPAGKETR